MVKRTLSTSLVVLTYILSCTPERGREVNNSKQGSEGENIGSGSGEITTSNPPETWEGFRESLNNNDLEQTLKYFSPHVQDSYREALTGRDLISLARKLPNLVEQRNPSDGFVEYEIEIDGELYAVTFNCRKNDCKIIGL